MRRNWYRKPGLCASREGRLDAAQVRAHAWRRPERDPTAEPSRSPLDHCRKPGRFAHSGSEWRLTDFQAPRAWGPEFFFQEPAPDEIYTHSLHDALPIPI